MTSGSGPGIRAAAMPQWPCPPACPPGSSSGSLPASCSTPPAESSRARGWRLASPSPLYASACTYRCALTLWTALLCTLTARIMLSYLRDGRRLVLLWLPAVAVAGVNLQAAHWPLLAARAAAFACRTRMRTADPAAAARGPRGRSPSAPPWRRCARRRFSTHMAPTGPSMS